MTESSPEFAHRSEREFAELLSYYRIQWEYEPKTFILQRDGNGNVSVGFTPDFYLPAHELYIELTTRKPNLMQRKRRKVEELRRQHPELNVKLMNRAELELLVKKLAARG
jgi:hypothetical protein